MFTVVIILFNIVEQMGHRTFFSTTKLTEPSWSPSSQPMKAGTLSPVTCQSQNLFYHLPSWQLQYACSFMAIHPIAYFYRYDSNQLFRQVTLWCISFLQYWYLEPLYFTCKSVKHSPNARPWCVSDISRLHKSCTYLQHRWQIYSLSL